MWTPEQRERYRQTREQERVYLRQWRLKNPNYERDRMRKWRKDNPELYREAYRRYQGNNREKLSDQAKARRKANPEKARESVRAWRREHPEYIENNREANRAYQRMWARLERLRHPERVVERVNRRRARKTASQVGLVDLKAVLKRDGRQCFICKGEILLFDKIHFDHWIPLSKGGPHTMENLHPTHDRCNMKKGAKTP